MTVKRSRFQGASHIVLSKGKRAIPYREIYQKLPPRERPKFNEKAIFAVLQLSNEGIRKGKICIVAPLGTRAFLEDRLRQLITDTKNYGFTKAAQRFRAAVKGWRREREDFYLRSDILVMDTTPAPPARFVRRRRWAASPPALKAARPPAHPYVPEGDEDLLEIPPFLDRKAEVLPNHPLRMCRKPKGKAA